MSKTPMWAVECKSNPWGFETIATFNSDTVAHRYAQQCADTNPHNSYRVMEPEIEKMLTQVDWQRVIDAVSNSDINSEDRIRILDILEA